MANERQRDRSPPLRAGEATLWLPASFALIVTIVCALWPAAVAVYRMTAGPREGTGDPGVSLAGAGLLWNTFFYSSLIAALAVVIAWPAAWVLRRPRPATIALIGAPLLGPSYLAYAGWGILRGHGTILSKVIAKADPAWHAPTIAWHANAVIGLVLWAWPLAAFTLAIALRRIPDQVLEMLRLEAPTRRQALRQHIAMSRSGLIWAFGLVLLVMLGSAVPLHVAQVRTWAIHVWTILQTSDDRWRAWAAGWPLLLTALVGAWLIGRRLDRPDANATESQSARASASRWHIAGLACVWTLSVVVPAALFLWSVKAVRHPDTGEILQTRFERLAHVGRLFLRESAEAIANSAANAFAVGAIGILVGGGVWAAASSHGAALQRAGRWCTRAFLVAGLVPGVLVGLAIHQAWDQPTFTRPVGETAAIFAIAHLARFSFIGALVGWLLGRTEPAQQRDLRAIDGATGLYGWGRICLTQSWPVLIGAGLAMAALSLHEIEAAIWVQRPGEPFLARQMLDDLHYARDDRLAVGVITMTIGGLAIGLAAAWLLGLGLRTRSARPDAS